jgi:hypothetical protein
MEPPVYVTQGGGVGEAMRRADRPRGAAVALRVCVAGLLILPVAVPLLLAASIAWSPEARLGRAIGIAVSVVIWLAMFVCAQVLTGPSPAGPRRPP